MEQNLPAVIDPSYGVDTYRTATNAATLCGEIVKATAQNIQGRKYVRVEGWMALAAAHGCLVSIAQVESVDGGIRAVAELKRMADGLVLATAEGFVGDDEPMWAKRPLYARRAMAQTRASSRVCRSAFSHCVVLIDKDLGTTPAEEMQGVIDNGGSVDGPGSSWGPGGKQSAVEEAERDGLTKNAPKATAAVLARAKARVDKDIQAFKMAGHTKDSLMEFWAANREAYDKIYEMVPAEHERLVAAYDEALQAAPKAAA